MSKVINQTLQPVVLESGTVIASAGTDGSVREDVVLSERDRQRYVEPGVLAVVEDTVPAPSITSASSSEPIAAESKPQRRNK